ncbi:MAG: hypothetical protein ACPGSC_15385, partial [Granulosicoccaceae bacterium]
IGDVVLLYRRDILALSEALPGPLTKDNKQSLNRRVKNYIDQGVPEALAVTAANVIPLSSAFDVGEVAHNGEADVEMVAEIYFELGATLELQWLRDQISELAVGNRWHALAKSRLRADLHNQQRKLTAEVLACKKGKASAKARLKHWCTIGEADQLAYHRLMGEVKAAGATDFAMLSVAVNEVHSLLQTTAAID